MLVAFNCVVQLRKLYVSLVDITLRIKVCVKWKFVIIDNIRGSHWLFHRVLALHGAGFDNLAVDNNFCTVVSQSVGCTVSSVSRNIFLNQLITGTTLVAFQKQHCKCNRVNYCGSAGLIVMIEQMAQNTEWLPELPSFQRRITGSSQQNYRFSSKLSYRWQNFLILRNTSQSTEEFKFARSWRRSLNIRTIRGFALVNWSSSRSMYMSTCLFSLH